MAGATVEETAFEDVNMWQALPFMTLYGNLECGRAKSGRRDLMGSQRVARPSLERGMEAASGKKRTLQHEGVTEGRGGNGSKPPPPHTMCHTPHWASAGRVAFYYFVFLKRRKCIRGHFLVVFGIRSGPSQRFFRIRRGIRRHPRVRWQICESKWLLFWTLPCDVAASQKSQGLVTIHPDLNFPPRNLLSKLIYKLRNMVRFRAILCLGVPIQCQRLQFYTRPWCQRFYRNFMAPLPCENTSAAWQLFFTARTGAKPHRLDSSVTLLLRRVVQSKTQ